MKEELLVKWNLTEIYRCREKISDLIDAGEPLTSPRLVALANHITDLWMKSDCRILAS